MAKAMNYHTGRIFMAATRAIMAGDPSIRCLVIEFDNIAPFIDSIDVSHLTR
jgi:hypothetical protein